MGISDSYYKSRSRKRLKFGGFTPEEQEAGAAGAGLLGEAVTAIAPANQYGRQATGAMAASGALKGAAAGMALGPMGAAAGAVIGGVTGLIGGMAAKKKEEKMIAETNMQELAKSQAMGDARLKADPTLQFGSLSKQYFAIGGAIGPDDPTKKPLSAADYNNWNAMVKYAKSKNLDPTALAKNSAMGYGVIDEYNKANPTAQFDRTRVKDIQQLMLDYRAKTIDKMKSISPAAQKATGFYPTQRYGDDFSGYMSGLSPADNFPGPKTLGWEVPNEYRITDTGLPEGKVVSNTPALPTRVMKAMGGQLSSNYRGTKAIGGSVVPMSSDGAEITGQSHAEGGVQLPDKGAEVEGGETMKDDFVYSAQLGFAQQHKPLLKARGIIEQKPATPERINALRILEQKENNLALAQEYFKKKHGIR